MSRGRDVFRTVCEAGDAAECVRSLEPWAWQDLYRYLVETHCEHGVSGGFPGEVLGMVLVEGAARYAQRTSNVERGTLKVEGERKKSK